MKPLRVSVTAGLFVLLLGAPVASWAQSIFCESQNYQQQYCPAGMRITGARIISQQSNSPCVQGRTWGYDANGVWVNQGTQRERYLGSLFSNVGLESGDTVSRPSAGGGGLGDPLERDENAVCEDVADGYVSIERAAKDYGVVVKEVDADLAQYEVDHEATLLQRASISSNRMKWLQQDAEDVAGKYRSGELDMLDLIRRYGVIVNWGSGELLANTTRQFRAMLMRRTAPYWGRSVSQGKDSSISLKVA